MTSHETVVLICWSPLRRLACASQCAQKLHMGHVPVGVVRPNEVR